MKFKARVENLVYIMAHSFSGSTLLTYLMAMHPQISTIGELKASPREDTDKYICSCGKSIKECHFWKNVRDEMQSRGCSFKLKNFGTRFRTNSLICNLLISSGIRNFFFEKMRNLGFILLPRCRHALIKILEQICSRH